MVTLYNEMNSYLQPVSDGLELRESGEWVKDKLFYIQRYIDTFETAMHKKPWRQRNYIDLFSGPGKCVIRETNECVLGSSLLALKTPHPFTHYYYCDIKPTSLNSLQERSKASTIPQSHIRWLLGDANKNVSVIVNDIKQLDRNYVKGLPSCLNLAVLDPDGLELEWATVEALGKMKTMDLIIHYSQNGLTRNLSKCFALDDETIIDRFFGDREWREIYRKALPNKETIGFHRALIDYYKKKLERLGYVVNDPQQNVREPLIRNTEKNAPLYRLLFASKHPLGNKFWNEVTARNSDGQQSLL